MTTLEKELTTFVHDRVAQMETVSRKVMNGEYSFIEDEIGMANFIRECYTDQYHLGKGAIAFATSVEGSSPEKDLLECNLIRTKEICRAIYARLMSGNTTRAKELLDEFH